MSFDKDTRNTLSKMVAACRRLLTEDVTDQLRGRFGMHPDGAILTIDRLDLAEDEKAAAESLRELLDHFAAGEAGRADERRRRAYDRLVLEISFTALNRLAALRLCEERGLVVDCVRQGTASDGFRLFERVAGGALGTRYKTYRVFIDGLFDELAQDLGVLFDCTTPQSAVFPSERCLNDVLAELNKPDLTPLWAADETIGWIYQYFNPPEERKAMRDASQAPRNSRELAVRNQFFTPRYVVEFLTDNTLGRIWYEMRKGETALVDDCCYLVRRSTEIFLAPGQDSPPAESADSDLSQEELLKQPVRIEHRPRKDPRDLRVLDPACGSGHFLLYAFDLLERIYDEAWHDPLGPKSEATGRALREDFETIEDVRRAAPKLIVEHNLHGIDIDSRAVQIAALALWLRAQKAWKTLGLKATDRLRIKRSSIVTAEPMPGEEDMRREFTAGLQPRVLGQLVDTVFEKMKIAGEAGSLLKIEEEIKGAVSAAKTEFVAEQRHQRNEAGFLPGMAPPREATLFDFTDFGEEEFWAKAEDLIHAALQDYAVHAEDGYALRRRLFAQDAARGFAFIDLCRKRYDVVLMNPPLTDAPARLSKNLKRTWPAANGQLGPLFLMRTPALLARQGLIGTLMNRPPLFIQGFDEFRSETLLRTITPIGLLDLGDGEFDDVIVEAAAIAAQGNQDGIPKATPPLPTFRLLGIEDKSRVLADAVANDRHAARFDVPVKLFQSVPMSPLCYWLPLELMQQFRLRENILQFDADVDVGLSTKNDKRHVRTYWEIPQHEIGLEESWAPYDKGGEYSPFFFPVDLVVRRRNSFQELHEELCCKFPYLKGNTSWVIHPEARYGSAGASFQMLTTKDLAPRVMPSGCVFYIAIIPSDGSKDRALLLTGLFNSAIVRVLVDALVGGGGGTLKNYEKGTVRRIPVPDLSTSDICELVAATQLAVDAKIGGLFRYLEPSTCFRGLPNRGSLRAAHHFLSQELCSARDRIRQAQADVDRVCMQAYGLSRGATARVEELVRQEEPLGKSSNLQEIASRYVSLWVGIAFDWWPSTHEWDDAADGKWHTNAARPKPKTIRADGLEMLVDDPGLSNTQAHRADIVRQTRSVLDLLWKDRAHEIEEEACEILGVKELRDYFRRPTGFFQDHLTRYSKSRRKAPIYWPLSTASGSYTIWLYYHRLTDQTVYAAVNKYLEPKISEIEHAATQIEKELEAASGREGTQLRDRLNEARAFAGELRELREELLRIGALPYKPNLNDGVIINAAPFHRLFRLRPWAKETEQVWRKLEKGEYDWAHLAYAIWPERVKETCRQDRSIAIAHGLEDLCEIEPPAAKGHGTRKGRKRKEVKG